jgi:formylglycine-generating enzyme required for sulfatase activity
MGDVLNVARANYAETGIGETSPVGCFPQGATPREEGEEGEVEGGVEELSGNVLEWYPRVAADGEEATARTVRRVLRGGSFNGPRGLARCASRFLFEPGFRNDDYLGFRVVLSPFRPWSSDL